MRQALAMLFLALLLGCAGCVTTAPSSVVVAPPKEIDFAQALPPVTPERVTEENYRSMAQALWDEMDREEQQGLLNGKRE